MWLRIGLLIFNLKQLPKTKQNPMNITQAIEQLQAFGEIHGFHTPLVLKAEVEGCGTIETRDIRIGLKQNEGYQNQLSIQNIDF